MFRVYKIGLQLRVGLFLLTKEIHGVPAEAKRAVWGSDQLLNSGPAANTASDARVKLVSVQRFHSCATCWWQEHMQDD